MVQEIAAMPSLITAPSPFKFQTQILDLLEFNSHQMIHFAGLDEDRTVFADALNAFEHLFKHTADSRWTALKKGRICNRATVASLVEFYRTHLLESDKKDFNLEKETDELVSFSFWNALSKKIYLVRERLLRKDADAFCIPFEDNVVGITATSDIEDGSVELNAVLSKTSSFTTDFDNLIHHCKVCRYVDMVEQMLVEQNKEIPDDLGLAWFGTAIQDHAKNNFKSKPEFLRKVLSVFKRGKSAKGKATASVSNLTSKLRPSKEVRQILDSLPDSISFYSLFLETIRNWVSLALSNPTLVILNYGSQQPTARNGASILVEGNIIFSDTNAVSRLQQQTELLSQTQRAGPDPRAIAEEIANKAIPDRHYPTDTIQEDLELHGGNESEAGKQRKTSAIAEEVANKAIPDIHDQSDSIQEELELRGGNDSEAREHRKTKRRRVPPAYYIHEQIYSNKSPQRKQHVASVELNSNKKRSVQQSEDEENGHSSESDDTEAGNEVSEKQLIAARKQRKRIHSESEEDDQSSKFDDKKANEKESRPLGRIEGEDHASSMPADHSNREDLQAAISNEVNGNKAEQFSGRLVERNRKAVTALVFESDSGVDSTHTSDSESPRKRAAKRPLGIDLNRLNVPKKRPFTNEEKNTFKLAIKKFGVGKWSEIKSAYGDIFRYRTNVQLKDLYRTMKKRNELDSDSS